jgi:hypothetical protein
MRSSALLDQYQRWTNLASLVATESPCLRMLLDGSDELRLSLAQRFYHHDFVPSLRLEIRAANQSESTLLGVAI